MLSRLLFFAAVLNAAMASSPSEDGASPRKVMIWVANPLNQTKLDAMIADLKTHRKSFTGIAYQFFAICGAGSNDVGGSNDCTDDEAKGIPHLAPGHPTHVPSDLGAQLKKALGDDVELWPTISYGNPGNATVLNELLTNAAAMAKFAMDAMTTAHAQNLTGYNFDLETGGVDSNNVERFLTILGTGLHAASPPIGVSWDGGNTPPSGAMVAPIDRWISMATYTSSLADFKSGLIQGLAASGEKFGVGLCPSCDAESTDAVNDRFDAIASIGKGKFQELDIWAYGEWPVFWWDAFEKWLTKSTELLAPSMLV